MIGMTYGRLTALAGSVAAFLSAAPAFAGPTTPLDGDPSVQDAAAQVFRVAFPHASAPPSDSELARTAQASGPIQPPIPAPAADPIEERSKACFQSAAGQTTSGMTECSHQAYVAYDQKLNDVYQAVLAHVDPASAALIREAQRRWVALQAADQAADNGPWRNDRGSMASPDIEALRVDAIRQRIAKLQYYYSSP